MNDILVIDGEMTPMQKAERMLKLAELKNKAEAAYNQLRDELLVTTKALDVITLKTGSYTITRVCRVTPKVVNFKTLKETLERENIPYTTKTVFGDEMIEVFKQVDKEGRKLEGLEVKKTEYVSIRGAK